MWIIPKTLSAFVPDTEGLNLELEEQAWMLESSAMWRSKPSSKQTWLRRLKKGGWITHLSTRILKPSLHESFVEKYTDSLEDIHANHSVQQASDKERKTQDTYGHTSSSTSEQLDLFGAFGKTSQDTPRWGYGESCPIWKKRVIDARGAYSQRKKLALHTKENECSSWGTPKEQDSRAASWDRGKSNLGEQVHGMAKSWATPQASDHIEGARTAKESNQKCLGRDLNQMNWATPNTMDYLPPKTGEALARNKKKGGCKNLREDVNNPKMNWPTPRAGNPGSRKPGTGGKILAEEAKKNWPTPRETMSRDATHDRGKCNLGEVVHNPKNWATPQSRDHKTAESKEKWQARAKLQAEKGVNLHLPLNTQCQHIMEEQHNGLQDQEKSNTSGKNQGSWLTPKSRDYRDVENHILRTGENVRKTGQKFSVGLPTQAHMKEFPEAKKAQAKLNPNWVEQLMGLPIGWTDLGSWGMELSHKQQN